MKQPASRRGDPGRVFDPHYPPDVVDAILAELPVDEYPSLRGRLLWIKDEAHTTAPHAMGMWWKYIASALAEEIGTETNITWKRVIWTIFADARN